jgi:hypothetical protein
MSGNQQQKALYSCYTPLFPYKSATIRVVKMHLAFSEKKLTESLPVRCDTENFGLEPRNLSQGSHLEITAAAAAESSLLPGND